MVNRDITWRGGRVVEGAALEMLFGGNFNEGSNPSLSVAIYKYILSCFTIFAHLDFFLLQFAPFSKVFPAWLFELCSVVYV